MMHRASLHTRLAKLVQLAYSDIRTRSVWSVDKSIVNLGLMVTARDAGVGVVALTRLLHALNPLLSPDDLIYHQSSRQAVVRKRRYAVIWRSKREGNP